MVVVVGHLQTPIFAYKIIGQWEEKKYSTSIIIQVPTEKIQVIDVKTFMMSDKQSDSILDAINLLIQVDIALRSGEIYENLGGIEVDDLVRSVIKLVELFHGTNKMFDEKLEESGTRRAALRKKKEMYVSARKDIIN